MAAGEFAEGHDGGGVHGVEDLVFAGFPGDEACVEEDVEVFGDVGLGGGEGIGKVGDAAGASDERLENGEAGGVREGFEEVGDLRKPAGVLIGWRIGV